MRRLEPDVGRVYAAVCLKADGFEAFADETGVFKVVGDGSRRLSLPFGREYGLCAALDDVGCAVVLRRVAAIPERVEALLRAVGAPALHALRQHDVAAARAREARCLREGAKFDGNVLRALNLEDGVRQIVLGDEGLISGIEENDGLVLSRVGDPSGERLARHRHARRVVR